MMPKKVTARTLRAIKTKKKLFRSAAKLIDKYGYDNVTIEDICRMSRVSIGAFYHYYNSKSDIIVELFKEIDSYFEEKVSPEFTNDPIDNIKLYFRHYAIFHVDQGYEHTSMVLKIQSDFYLDKTRYMHILLDEIIHAAKSQNKFGDDADVDAVADFLLVVARGLLFDWSLAQGGYDLTAKMDSYIEIALHSFK